MKEIKKPAEGLSTAKAVLGIILSIAILAIAQTLAFVISEFLLNLGVPGAICNVIAGVLYVALALAGITLLCKKILKVDMSEMRIPRFKVKGVWLIAAVLMPALVLLISILTGGHWEMNIFNTENTLATITSAVVFFGLATGIVEEVVSGA